MCHETDARPPLPPIRGGAVDAREVELTSADGTRFAAHLSIAADPGGPGIVIMPDVRGLHPFYEDLANRLAEAGVHALALDLYARTAGPGRRGADFEFMPHVEQTEHPTIAADVRAAVEAMRTAEFGAAERVYTMGFCFGGRASFVQAGEGHRPGRRHRLLWLRVRARAARACRSRSSGCPRSSARCSACSAALTRGSPPTASPPSTSALTGAGIDHELITYPGAPHSFFDRIRRRPCRGRAGRVAPGARLRRESPSPG